MRADTLWILSLTASTRWSVVGQHFSPITSYACSLASLGNLSSLWQEFSWNGYLVVTSQIDYFSCSCLWVWDMSFHCIALHCLTYYTDNRYSTTTHLHCPNNNIWLIYNIKLSPARRMQQRLNVVISALLVLVLNIAVTAGRDGRGTVGVSKECFYRFDIEHFLLLGWYVSGVDCQQSTTIIELCRGAFCLRL